MREERESNRRLMQETESVIINNKSSDKRLSQRERVEISLSPSRAQTTCTQTRKEGEREKEQLQLQQRMDTQQRELTDTLELNEGR